LLSLDGYLGPITDPDFSVKDPDVVVTRGRRKADLQDEVFEVSLGSLGIGEH